MEGILIRYDYDGDEEVWEQAIRTFVTSIDADEALRGKFSYIVTRVDGSPGRVHMGRWDSDATLEHLQS